jgi:hypothetical protein
MRHDRGKHGGDILGRWLFALGEREEIASTGLERSPSGR